MNIPRSIRMCLAMCGENQAWLASQLGISHQAVSHMMKSKHASGKRIDALAAIFELKASEFVAIGEE